VIGDCASCMTGSRAIGVFPIDYLAEIV
jgi:hypothetical protein